MINTKNDSMEPRHIIAIIIFALAIFGLVILSSASAIIAHKNFGSNDFYFWKQFRHLIVGLVIWSIFYNIPYRAYKKITPIIYGIGLFSLVLVFIPGIGAEYGTAHSWIDLPLLPSIQPAEYMKLTLILYLAFICERKREKITDFKDGVLPVILIVGLVVGLIILQPDYGTALIFIVVSASIVYIAGADRLHMATGFILGSCMAVIVASNKSYIYDRFTAFLDPFSANLGTGYHIIQSLIAVGSGGFFGKGFGNSRQKFEYIPEAQGDSIFAIASEELGFVRVSLIVLMFIIIAWQGYKIAGKTDDLFGKYVAVGITSWITFQALVNIMVVLALFPTTGIPLPFISYGGSSILSSFMAIGILMNIAKFDGKKSPVKRKTQNTFANRSAGSNMYKKRRRW